jgi:hypothetical protein
MGLTMPPKPVPEACCFLRPTPLPATRSIGTSPPPYHRPLYGACVFQNTSSGNLLSHTVRDQSQIPTSSLLADFFNTKSAPSVSISANAPSATKLTTLPPSSGPAKALPPLRNLLRTCCASCRCTNGTTAMSRSMTTCLAPSIAWPTTPPVYGPCLTLPSYTILTPLTHSPHPGNFITRCPTSAPQ